jgi:2-hydroxy-6-oxonona-2,4-dienedioate hydrolase
LHGGVPGVTPFCSGAHIWGDCLEVFCSTRDVIAVDLPGSGGTELGAEPVTVETLGRHVLGVLSALSIASVDLVGHDLGGLIAIWLALEQPNIVRGLSVVASPMSPPTADGLDNLLLLSPPRLAWSRESQAWAFDRLSYSHSHISAALLDACVAASEAWPHRAAVEEMKDGYAGVFMPSLSRTKYRLWESCRNEGLGVPTQLVWPSHDPASSRESGFVLFNAIAPRQPAAQFHLINRAGSFPFREQLESFHHVVSTFQEGVWEEAHPTGA